MWQQPTAKRGINLWASRVRQDDRRNCYFIIVEIWIIVVKNFFIEISTLVWSHHILISKYLIWIGDKNKSYRSRIKIYNFIVDNISFQISYPRKICLILLYFEILNHPTRKICLKLKAHMITSPISRIYQSSGNSEKWDLHGWIHWNVIQEKVVPLYSQLCDNLLCSLDVHYFSWWLRSIGK